MVAIHKYYRTGIIKSKNKYYVLTVPHYTHRCLPHTKIFYTLIYTYKQQNILKLIINLLFQTIMIFLNIYIENYDINILHLNEDTRVHTHTHTHVQTHTHTHTHTHALTQTCLLYPPCHVSCCPSDEIFLN